MAEWSIPLDQWAELQKEKIHEARRVFAFDVFSNVLTRTPVDTGAARQNWLVTLNAITNEYDANKHKGQRVLANGRKVIDNAQGDDTIVIQNNLPYITMLEYGGYGKQKGQGASLKGKAHLHKGTPRLPEKTEKATKTSKITADGFSLQAPQGMVGVTMAEAPQMFQDAVKTVSEWKV